jgi:hypothetical protein
MLYLNFRAAFRRRTKSGEPQPGRDVSFSISLCPKEGAHLWLRPSLSEQ